VRQTWLMCSGHGETKFDTTVARHWSIRRQLVVSELHVQWSTDTTDSLAEKQHACSVISHLQGVYCVSCVLYKTYTGCHVFHNIACVQVWLETKKSDILCCVFVIAILTYLVIQPKARDQWFLYRPQEVWQALS